MALQDILGTPDKVEVDADVTLIPRYNVSTSGVTVAGNIKRTDTRTTSTWTAATRAACVAYEQLYTGAGAIAITQQNGVVNSWQLVLTEQTITVEWVPA